MLAILALVRRLPKKGRLADARRDGGYNLLLITLDTTRADRIGAFGDSRAQTPHLDRLAREGVRFDHAHTSVPLTLPAHATLMTGREPPAHQVRNNGTYSCAPKRPPWPRCSRRPASPPRRLSLPMCWRKNSASPRDSMTTTTGWEFNSLAPIFAAKSPPTRCTTSSPAGWTVNPPSPFFCWVHFYDPHAPYQAPAAFNDLFPDDPYRGEIAFMDEYIGRMVKDLEQRGLLAKTLVVVAGDHGEGFAEHGESEHGVFCYEETLRVPLIFYQPRLFPGGRVVSRPVGLVDVLPTILELYRLPPPPGVQGRSFARLLTAAKDPGGAVATHYFESMYGLEEMGWAPLSGLMRGSLKYISLPRPELYDLAADPQELDNLYLKKNSLAKQLGRELDDRLRQITRTKAAALRQRPTGQDQARLRALGYLASTGPLPQAGSGEDPKEGIGTMNRLREVKQAISSGDLAGAERLLAALRAAGVNQKIPQFYDLLLRIAGTPATTLLAAESLLARGHYPLPRLTRFPLLLASFYRNRSMSAEAEEMARVSLQKIPRPSRPTSCLGEIYREQRIDR